MGAGYSDMRYDSCVGCAPFGRDVLLRISVSEKESMEDQEQPHDVAILVGKFTYS